MRKFVGLLCAAVTGTYFVGATPPAAAAQEIIWGPISSVPTGGPVADSSVVTHSKSDMAMAIWRTGSSAGASSIESSLARVSGSQVSWQQPVNVTPTNARVSSLQVNASEESGRTVATFCLQESANLKPAFQFSSVDLSKSEPTWTPPAVIYNADGTFLECNAQVEYSYQSTLSSDGSTLFMTTPRGMRTVEPGLWITKISNPSGPSRFSRLYAKRADGEIQPMGINNTGCLMGFDYRCGRFDSEILTVDAVGNIAVMSFRFEWPREWPASGSYGVYQTATWRSDSSELEPPDVDVNSEVGLVGSPQAFQVAQDGTRLLSLARTQSGRAGPRASTQAFVQSARLSGTGWDWDGGVSVGIYGVGGAAFVANKDMSFATAAWESRGLNAVAGTRGNNSFSWQDPLLLPRDSGVQFGDGSKRIFEIQENLALSADEKYVMIGQSSSKGYGLTLGYFSGETLMWTPLSSATSGSVTAPAVSALSGVGRFITSWQLAGDPDTFQVRVGTAGEVSDRTPTKPQALKYDVAYSARKASISVSWEAPASTGGAPVLYYEYRYRFAKRWTRWSKTVDPQASFAVATKKPREKLVFEVRAVNSVGVGTASKLATVLRKR